MVKWLKHAFAVDPPGPATPTEDQKRVVDRLAGEIVRRGLTAPALLFLESSRPLNYLGSQLLVFCAPFAEIIFKPADYRALTTFLEHRGFDDTRPAGDHQQPHAGVLHQRLRLWSRKARPSRRWRATREDSRARSSMPGESAW